MKNKTAWLIAIIIVMSIISIVLAIQAKSQGFFGGMPELEIVDTIEPIETIAEDKIIETSAAVSLEAPTGIETASPIQTTIEETQIDVPETSLPVSDIIALARTIQGEAGSNSIPRYQQAAVAWCVLNRYDAWKDRYGYKSIADVCAAPNQFHGYWLVIQPRQDMIDLAKDVLIRWELEKQGNTDAGRTLPKEYLYFWGDGRENHFRINNSDQVYWDWSYANPYA